MSYIVAVDIGTTSTKTMVIHRSGRIMASNDVEYPLHTPRPDMAVQDPLELFRAVITGTKAVMDKSDIQPAEVMCVSFSSAMHSLIAVDRELNPLTDCITFADNRSAAYAERLKSEGTGHAIYLNTGTPIHPMSPLLKLMWLKDNEPGVFERAYKFIGIKEFVFAKLFGTFVVDHSLASATGLLNLKRLDWDEEALLTAGISRDKLSEPVPTTYQVTGLPSAYAAAMGLHPDTPFVVGASDGVLANLGTGASEPGVLAVTIGTSGAVRGVVDKPITDPEGRLFCYALDPDYWVIGGAINNGGIMLRWVRDQLATLEAEIGRKRGEDPYLILTELASQVAPGSDGLIFLPFLSGERAPYWNANARGMFFGLSLYHEKKHMIRAVMEGVAYRIHSVMKALEEIGGPAAEIRASGGFARSELWIRIMADVLETPVAVPQSIQSSAVGAAQLGLKAMGEIRSYAEVKDWLNIQTEYPPDPANFGAYRRLTDIYGKVYHQLKNEFDSIAEYQNQMNKHS